MKYSEALRYLNSFIDLEKLAQFPGNPFFNLKRMKHLLTASGHLEKQFFPILIAGTTGKGSTGFFLESVLKTNGIRVGYYHSPHVEDPRERIRVQGTMVSRKLWAEGLSAVQKLLLKKPLPKAWGVLTYFEVLTFLAVWIFAKLRVKIGIFEIGLGGRLDATNVLKAPLVILTPIHLDHEAFLGNTVAKIAAEKAAIIKSHGHTVIGRQFPEALRVIRRAVKTNRGTLWKARPVSSRIPLGLAGNFQKMNAGTALKAAEILKKQFGFSIASGRSKAGLRSEKWKGRMECFYQGGRRFILDGAHNPLSTNELVKALHQPLYTPGVYKGDREVARRMSGTGKDAWLVFGAMNDKNSRAMLRILSRSFSNVILTGIANSRAKPVAMLVEEAKGLFKCMLTAQNIGDALEMMRQATDPGTRAVVTGSFYLVGEARKILSHG